MGCAFPLEPSAEITFQNWHSERDVLSFLGPRRKLRPGIQSRSGMRFPDRPSTGSCVPESTLGTGCAFPWGSQRKMYPGIRPRSGMRFPERSSTGNCVPESTLGAGYAFRNGLQAEMASHSEPSFRDAVSARHAIWKAHPVLSAQSGTWFPQVLPNRKACPGLAGRRAYAQQPLQLNIVEPCRQRGLPDACRLQLFGEHSCRADLVHGKAQQRVAVER